MMLAMSLIVSRDEFYLNHVTIDLMILLRFRLHMNYYESFYLFPPRLPLILYLTAIPQLSKKILEILFGKISRKNRKFSKISEIFKGRMSLTIGRESEFESCLIKFVLIELVLLI